MSLPIIWLADADAELQSLFNRLEDHREDSGAEFLAKLQTYLHNISLFPEIAPLFLRRIRRQVISRSNHGLFYVVYPTRIVVIAFLDLRQDEGRIRRRLLNGEDGDV